MDPDSPKPRLKEKFYRSDDVIAVAKALIGKTLVTQIEGTIASAIITETEAYHQDEKACHAYNGRRTARTEILYAEGGISYVYLCYGIHHLFNVVTGSQGVAAAVLIRAAQPLEGVQIMLERRGLEQSHPKISAGPGKLSQALGLTLKNNGTSLISGNDIWIEPGKNIPQDSIVASPRIGVDYAQEDALLPWRFYVEGSRWVSKP